MEPQPTYDTPQTFDPNQDQIKKRKIIAAIVLIGFLIIVAAVVVAILAGSSKSKQMGLVLAKQNEVIRVLDEYGDQVSSSASKALVARATVVLKSDANELNRAGINPSSDQLQAAIIPGIDDVMADAVRSSRLDEVLSDYLQETVAENLQLTEETIKSTNNKQLKLVLETVAENYKNLF